GESMSSEPTDSGVLKQFVQSLVESALPRGLRVEYMRYLKHWTRPLARWLAEAVWTIVSAYRIQAVHAFNKYANLPLVGVVLFSFASAPEWPGPFVALMVMLLVFITRDAYIYKHETYPDGITDAALALLFLLADEALTLQWAPALTMPKGVFFK